MKSSLKHYGFSLKKDSLACALCGCILPFGTWWRRNPKSKHAGIGAHRAEEHLLERGFLRVTDHLHGAGLLLSSLALCLGACLYPLLAAEVLLSPVLYKGDIYLQAWFFFSFPQKRSK